jgi:hypothetical protein
MAKVEPDTYFFGFDLTVEQARGGGGVSSYDDPGWFFVLREQSDEPLFGLDGKKSDLNDWNELSWERAAPGSAAGAHIQINNPTTPFKAPAPALAEEREKGEHREDGVFMKRNKDSNPADPPYILRQAPTLLAIHAAEMLLKK